MRVLKITLTGVGLLVLLKVSEIVLTKFSPLTLLFYQNLFKSLQLLVLASFFLSLLFTFFMKDSPFRIQRISILFVLFFTVTFEMLFGYWMHHPGSIPSFFLSSFRQYYSINYRKVVQVEPGCSEYDSNFFYRLRPNVQSVFSNIEFSTLIETNSAGLRDDEQSLNAPDVICIGDSYTMGWGVQQQETFPQRLERTTGLKVLNAGISSFGTVRELRKLRTLDTARCKWIVLQYCDNDIQENKSFVDNNYSLNTSSRSSYDTLVNRYEWNRMYYPGKTFLSVSGYLLSSAMKNRIVNNSMVEVGNQTMCMNETIRLFDETLCYFNPSLASTNIIVLYANEKDYPDERFTKALQQLLERRSYKRRVANRIFILNTSNVLNKGDRYLLDDHYNASGHNKIASAVRKIIYQHPAASAQP